MTLSPTPPPPPPKRNRPSGPRKQGPRQHFPSVAPSIPRSTLSPAPGRERLIRSPAPTHKSAHGSRRQCQNPDCQNSDIIEDEAGGGLICQGCGMVVSESNIVAENTWIEGPGGTSGMAGQYVGGNQSAPRTLTGMGGKIGYGAGREALDPKVASENRAKDEMDKILRNLGAQGFMSAQGLQIYKLAVQHGLLHGRTVTLVAAVALYVALRRNPRDNSVMLMDIAEVTSTNVFVLGNLYTRMVDKLKGIGGMYDRPIEPMNPEALLSKFAQELEFGKDKGKIVKEALRIFSRMKRDWMTEGRRPAGICGAAIVLAARMNNYRRTVREVVLIAKVTEITLNKRLEEFKMTDASKWDVQKFRELADAETDGKGNWIGGTLQGLPPAFYAANTEKVKKKRGRPRKIRPGEAIAAQVEVGTADNPVGPDESESSPPAKRPRFDKEGFAIPEIPIDPKLRQSVPSTGEQVASPTAPGVPAIDLPASTASSDQQRSPAPTNSDPSSQNIPEVLQDVPPSESERELSATLSSARGDTPMSESGVSRKKRGRRPGTKNSRPPPPTPSELAVEDELERDIRYGLEEAAGSMEDGSDGRRIARAMTEEANRSADEAIRRRTASATPSRDPTVPPVDTPADLRATLNVSLNDTPKPRQKKVPGIAITMFSTIGNTNTISLSPTISAVEFDSDPDVSSCLLTETEQEIKERIWVAENADWLRKDHAKKIKRQLEEQRMREMGIDPEAPKKKGKKRVTKDQYMAEVNQNRRERTGQEGVTDWAEAAEEATNAMLANRAATTYSRRFNPDIFKGIMNDGGSPSSSSRSRSRSHSVISIRSADTVLGSSNLPFDEAGPLGPTMARTKHSLAAQKREAAKRAKGGVGKANVKAKPAKKTTTGGAATGTSQSSSPSPSPAPSAGPSIQAQRQLPTPVATQLQTQSAIATNISRPPSRDSQTNPDIEMGEVEVVGSIESPLSSMHSSHRNSPALGASQQGGFGEDEEEEDDEEDGEDEEVYVESEPEDDPDGALAGLARHRSLSDDDEEESEEEA